MKKKKVVGKRNVCVGRGFEVVWFSGESCIFTWCTCRRYLGSVYSKLSFVQIHDIKNDAYINEKDKKYDLEVFYYIIFCVLYFVYLCFIYYCF